MPITLPPISRRRFLRGALAAAGAVALAPDLTWADQSSTADPDHLVLLSDIHLDAKPDAVSRGVNMLEHFHQVREQILSHMPLASAMLINGDCAHLRGRPSDYAAVAKALEPIRAAGLPIHLALGNHDSRQHLRAGLGSDPDQAKKLTDRRVLRLKLPSADWYMLDSLKETDKVPGLLGLEQLQWLSSSLDASPDRPAIVMLHHQPDSRAPEKISGLLDTRAFLDIVQPRQQVKAVLFGHTHQWHHYKKQGLHFVNLPTTAYVFHPNQPAGWVDAHLTRQSMKLQLHPITPNQTGEGDTLDLAWR